MGHLGVDPFLLFTGGDELLLGVLELLGRVGDGPFGGSALPLVPGVRLGALLAHPRGEVGQSPQLRRVRLAGHRFVHRLGP